ncbi:AEC family transporter [Mesoplasma photuris]|uniref:AEC family transporter n=1 Tax=Mesoplasma photuris TaxID=217731 RepID=UPI0004E13BD6|nr:AEC family transporter [Mesoplasma photuris]
MTDLLTKNNVGDAVVGVLSSWGFWGAIASTIVVIALGFILTKRKVLKAEWDKVLIKLVLIVGLPALAFKGFMTEASIEQLKSEAMVLLIGFLFYTIMIFGARIFFIKYERDIQDTLTMCIALASTTFFGTPIVTALWGDDGGIISANIFNIPYRIFLYSLGFMVMSRKILSSTTKTKKMKADLTEVELAESKEIAKTNRKAAMKNIFVNPILIATVVGFIIWVTQLIPGINVVEMAGVNNNEAFSPLRIDLLLPPIGQILGVVSGICTPLAWIAIGIQLAKGNLKDAFKSKTAWYAAGIKVVVAPLIILLITLAIGGIAYAATGEAQIKFVGLGALVIMTASPPASVVVSYAIAYDKQARLASELTAVSTVAAIVSMPIWVVIVTVVGTLPMFS